jgi:hypothetical protein
MRKFDSLCQCRGCGDDIILIHNGRSAPWLELISPLLGREQRRQATLTAIDRQQWHMVGEVAVSVGPDGGRSVKAVAQLRQ